MNTSAIFDTLSTLTTTPGPSGGESPVANAIMDMWKPLVDSVSIDRVGNVVAVKKGTQEVEEGETRRSVQLSAHMDEIALMVTEITEAHNFGYLRVTKVGGIDVRQQYAQRVTVHGAEPILGVIACLPSAMLPPERRARAFGFEDVVVDTGLGIERLKEVVSVGDFVTFEQPLRKLSGNVVTGKALDNRACVAVVTHTLMELQNRPHVWDVVATATVTEETNMLGGSVAGYGVNPDVAVALDVSFASQPGATGADTVKMGEGPILDIGVNVHPTIFNCLQDVGKRIEMKTHTLPHARSSGTETRVIQLARAGVPTGLVSIAIRNMHTVVESADLRDLGRAARLLTEFVVGLDETIISKMQDTLFITLESKTE